MGNAGLRFPRSSFCPALPRPASPPVTQPVFSAVNAADSHAVAGKQVTNPSAYVTNAYWLLCMPAMAVVVLLFVDTDPKDRTLRKALRECRLRLCGERVCIIKVRVLLHSRDNNYPIPPTPTPRQVMDKRERAVEFDAYRVATAALHRKLSLATILAASEPPLDLQVRGGRQQPQERERERERSPMPAAAGDPRRDGPAAREHRAPGVDARCTAGGGRARQVAGSGPGERCR